MISRILLAATVIIGASTTVSAQAIRCSAFLHNRDGSWTSFDSSTVLGPRGPIAIETGERFRPDGRSAKDDIARILDHICND